MPETFEIPPAVIAFERNVLEPLLATASGRLVDSDLSDREKMMAAIRFAYGALGIATGAFLIDAGWEVTGKNVKTAETRILKAWLMKPAVDPTNVVFF